MEKYYRLKTLSNCVFVASAVFLVITTAGLIGDIAYRIADQMWALGRYYSIIAMMVGCSVSAILIIVQYIILSIQRRILKNEVKRTEQEIELYRLAIKAVEKADHIG